MQRIFGLRIIPSVLLSVLLAFSVVANAEPSQDSLDFAQKMFVAYYGRPGDPGGIDFWAGKFDQSDNLDEALSDFGTSAEFSDSFGLLDHEQLIDGLFVQMFNRDPDVGGLAFYVDRLQSGEATLASIATQIADGAINDDFLTLNNKISVANEFTTRIDAEGIAYQAADIPVAQALLVNVTAQSDSVTAALAAVADFPDIDADPTEPDATALDPDVLPVTQGDWYKPPVLVTWQWQLQGSVNTAYDVEIYDIDLFESSTELIGQLQATGKKVICYFSAGSYEDWRSDADQFDGSELGNTLDGFADERWLDVRSSNVHAIMQGRLDVAQQKGCDGVEPDNMDGYTNNPGFDFTATDQLAFNRFIANEAHLRELSVGLKNDLDQIVELVDYYDFAVNEQCFEYDECDTTTPFIDNGKAVLSAEYLEKYVDSAAARATLCDTAGMLQLSTLVLPLDLDDSLRFSCQ